MTSVVVTTCSAAVCISSNSRGGRAESRLRWSRCSRGNGHVVANVVADDPTQKRELLETPIEFDRVLLGVGDVDDDARHEVWRTTLVAIGDAFNV